ncbi:hypothetical protein LNV08_22820 [Paucibacter sp. TC2R-5]|uniref:hypothetical protein n=1 Tax=Paucibacter sp. TC2R-5 TaxID=2893555 RepID=UPI0021E4FCA6|nr:hypothetical protein [Paucibacter sp. TC2R-5]MCV2361797.1 hypothetical protein [Paucibacter sp. TC2R-5]
MFLIVYQRALLMSVLPSFDLVGYGGLLRDLVSSGFNFRPIVDIGSCEAGDVFLRHDVDFSLELSLALAQVEFELGVSSCYYVLLSGPYNPCSASSINAMMRLRAMGHAIGLHYDLSLYPDQSVLARQRLDAEIRFLQEISDGEVKTIVMHEPSRGQEDFFLDAAPYINPTHFQKTHHDLLYVSDSCRAWRDLSLLEFLDGRSEKSCLMLNVHPESWLAERPQHRLTYLERTLLPKVLEPTQRYFMESVRHSWQTHIGPVHGYGDSDA